MRGGSTIIEASPEAKSQGWQVITKVAPYLWPSDQPWVKIRVVTSLFMLVLAKAIAITTPFFYKWAVDALAGEDGAQNLLFGAIGLTVAYGVARAMNVGFQQLRDAIFAKVAQRALRTLALETFAHIHRLSMRYHLTRKTGGLSRIIERGVKGVEFLLRFLVFSIGPLILELVLISSILFWQFGVSYLLAVLVTILLYVVFTFRVTEWRVKIRRRMNKEDTTANQKAIDSLLNFETVKYFGAEKREADRYDESMQGYEKAALKTAHSLALLNFGQSVIITTGLVVVMILAAQGVQDGSLTVGDFVLVNAFMIQITMPLNFLGTVYREIRQAVVDMGEMFALLGRPPEVTDQPSALPLEIGRGEVRFEDVHFSYDGVRTVLNGVSFSIEAGKKLAIVGQSGSGKSTIGRLLFRFYDVSSGAILIDNQDIRSVTQSSLRSSIGVVPQDTVLFNDTIHYNIAYGEPNASNEEVVSAAKSAKVHDFIQKLTDGYSTEVGERGLKLSGGEKQRIGIARTLLKNPKLLILDEATSALDTETELRIKTDIDELIDNKAVVVIAHRLSTIVDADMIIVLQEGQIVERGTHSHLIDCNGVYASMWAAQEL